jgi:hypothetical protein
MILHYGQEVLYHGGRSGVAVGTRTGTALHARRIFPIAMAAVAATNARGSDTLRQELDAHTLVSTTTTTHRRGTIVVHGGLLTCVKRHVVRPSTEITYCTSQTCFEISFLGYLPVWLADTCV